MKIDREYIKCKGEYIKCKGEQKSRGMARISRSAQDAGVPEKKHKRALNLKHLSNSLEPLGTTIASFILRAHTDDFTTITILCSLGRPIDYFLRCVCTRKKHPANIKTCLLLLLHFFSTFCLPHTGVPLLTPSKVSLSKLVLRAGTYSRIWLLVSSAFATCPHRTKTSNQHPRFCAQVS